MSTKQSHERRNAHYNESNSPVVAAVIKPLFQILQMKKIFYFLAALMLHSTLFAQTEQERSKIAASVNTKELNGLKQTFEKQHLDSERKVNAFLRQNPTLKRSFMMNGSLYYLQSIDDNGKPVYINTKNNESGKLIKADQLYTGGSLGVNISGQNMVVGVWDGGQVRATHELLSGKVAQQVGQTFDGSANGFGGNNHQTHVTGTIVGKDIANQPSARGIAYSASALNYDWTDDKTEMASFATSGYLISNHSYGYGNNEGDPIWRFGAYNDDAKNWDKILHAAPNYLAFVAGGNEQNPEAKKDDGKYINGNRTKLGYDMMTGSSAAKNVMTVGAVNGDKTMSDYSNWGPTDDGRVKPEIVAKGTGINSSLFADKTTNMPSDNAYSGNGSESSGTSYATPAAAAGGLLLQQYYKSLHGSYMNAATLKALMLGTAEDLGQAGPDHKFGWGLLDVEKAAKAIKTRSSSVNPTSQGHSDFTSSKGSYIEEVTYNLQPYVLTDPNRKELNRIVKAKGGEPLIISIAWTDTEGTEQEETDGTDPTASRLVHEFDMLARILSPSQDYRPWKPSTMANRTADATTQTDWFDGNGNNYKQIKILNPVAGAQYLIYIRKKGSSPSTLMPFSLVVTGTAEPVCTPPTVSIAGASSICPSTTTTLSPTTGGTWASSNTAVATVTNAGVVTGVSAGTATFTFTETSTNCTSNPTAVVTVNPKPVVSITDANAICVGATTTLSPTTGGTWASSNTAVATVTNAGVVTGVSAGTATFTFTETSTNCTSNPTAAVTVNALPTIGGPSTVKVGETITLTGGSGVTIVPVSISVTVVSAYASSDNAIATVSSSGVVTGVAVGTATITYTDAKGCKGTKNITVTPACTPPAVFNVTGGGDYCTGGTGVAIGLSSTEQGVNYQLKINGNNDGNPRANSGGVALPFGTKTAAGTYTVEANRNGCTEQMTGSVVITDITPTKFDVTGGGAYCAGGTGVAVGLNGSQAGVSYQLKKGTENVGSAVLSPGTAGGNLRTVTEAGIYTVVATGAGCSATMNGSATVTVNPLPTLTGPSTVKVGETITLTGGSGVTIVPASIAVVSAYASSDNAIATVSSSGVVTGVAAGTATITYTDGNGCKGTKNITVTPACTLPTVSGPANLLDNNTTRQCGKNITYNSTVTGVPTPSTSYTLTGATTGAGSGNGSGSFFNVGKTKVTLTATNSCGMGTYSFDVTINDTEKPTITCPPSQTIALGSFECGRVVVFADPSVSDNCSATFSRTDAFKTTLKSGSSFGAGTYPLSYRATDGAGNFADCNFTIQVNGQSTSGRLKCIPTLTVALDERQCSNTLDATGLLIDNIYYCGSAYNATIAGRTNNNLTSADIGKTFTVTVGDNSNNSCSTIVTVVDTKAPVLNSAQDAVITCADVSRDGRILSTLSQPTIISECGRTTFRTQDRVINLPAGQTSFNTRPDGFPTDKNFDFTSAFNANSIIVRTYTATDESNNSSSVQQIVYVKNIELSQVQCPKDVTLSCTQIGFSTDIQSAGIPLVSNGRSLQEVSCGIDYLYSDERTNNAQGYVIKRTWTLISRSNNQRQNCTQTITVNCANIPLLALSGSINKETGENVPAMVKIYTPTEMMSEMQGGSFLFNNLVKGSSYRIQPERDNDVSNGVTTFDIALLSKHILDLQPFTSPYQMIAADVNRDGQIDGSDMLLIRNLILRRITRFPSNTAWRFIPKSFVFADNKNPFADDFPEVLNYTNLSSNMDKADFVAVKVGDVNINARAANVLSLATRTARPTENIYLTDKKMEAGKEYVFDVNIKNSTLKALQLALKIDKTQVTSFSVETGNLPQFETGNLEVNQKQGIVGMAWANTSKGTLLDQNSIIQLRITPRQSAWLHELVSLDEQNMENLAYDTEGGIEKQLQLKFNTLKTENPEFELHQNRPNPFVNETTISFILPETNNATLSIYDVNGREVYSLKQAFNKGYNEVKLDKTVLKNAGVYFYRLQSDKFTAMKRLQYFVN